MSLQSLEIAVVALVCLHIVLWLFWIVRFARASPTPCYTLRVGSAVLLVFSAVPVTFFIVDLWRTFQGRSYILWFGLGCTASALEIEAALTYISIFRKIHVFKPEAIEGISQPFPQIGLCLLGFSASIIAIVAAGREDLDVGLTLASFGGSCVHGASSWWADGSKAKILQLLTLLILAGVVLTPGVHSLAAQRRDNVKPTSDKLSRILFLLFLSGILVHALIVDFDTLPNFTASHRMLHSAAPSVNELQLTTRNDPSRSSSKDLEKQETDTTGEVQRDANPGRYSPGLSDKDDILPPSPRRAFSRSACQTLNAPTASLSLFPRP